VDSFSARRLTAAVILIVVGAVIAVFWLTPSAGAAVSRATERAGKAGPTAVTSAARRPSPRVRRRKAKRPPRALVGAGAHRRERGPSRRRVRVR
jgi:hypothetical protein